MSPVNIGLICLRKDNILPDSSYVIGISFRLWTKSHCPAGGDGEIHRRDRRQAGHVIISWLTQFKILSDM